jgi:hypothetical protein
MKKHIVLSVNDNPDYLFHVPLVCWAWNILGWNPLLFFHGPLTSDAYELICQYTREIDMDVIPIGKIQGYQPETITQVSRLYGACVADGYLMTGDIDMLPLSDYWKPDPDKLTVYGRDLTDYHYPICYIGAPTEVWRSIMALKGDDYNGFIKEDLDSLPQAKSVDKVRRWVTDQDLITERINSSSFIPTRIDRGSYTKTGYPIGRIDRSAWSLDHHKFIDCHMFHGIQRDEDKFKKTLEMLHHVWPQEDFKWWINYYKEFKKLCQR